MALQAVVIGTGWAAEGHVRALARSGVEVVAVCGRSAEPTQALIERLAVPAGRLDWRAALSDFGPDIVAIATPGGAHHAVAVAAAGLGCHVVCEKPLAVTAAEARDMVAAVERADVKHGYAATGPYSAAFRHTRRLLADGVIGQPRVIQVQLEGGSFPPPTLPYSWHHQLKEGGGMLNNVFTHLLQQMLFLTQGAVTAAMGTTYRSLHRAPLGPVAHDARRVSEVLLSPERAEVARWRPVDADQGFTVLLQLKMPEGGAATALVTMPEDTHEPYPNCIVMHGSGGSLRLSAAPGEHIPEGRLQHFDAAVGTWVDLPIPDAGVAAAEDGPQRRWNEFFEEFVADVRSEGYAGYPTFHDGRVAVDIMENVRSGGSWMPVVS